MLGILATMVAYFFYLIAGCALIGAVVTQSIFFGKVGRIGLPMDFYRDPRQLKGFIIFTVLIFIGFFALVTGRSFELGHAPFLSH
jgi:hypothetical protein